MEWSMMGWRNEWRTAGADAVEEYEVLFGTSQWRWLARDAAGCDELWVGLFGDVWSVRLYVRGFESGQMGEESARVRSIVNKS